MKRTNMTMEDAAVLLESYDEWLGNIDPLHWDDYLGRFDRLRNRLEKAGYVIIEESGRAYAVEKEDEIVSCT